MEHRVLVDVEREIRMLTSTLDNYRFFQKQLKSLLLVTDLRQACHFMPGSMGPRGFTNCPCCFRQISYDMNWDHYIRAPRSEPEDWSLVNAQYQNLLTALSSVPDEELWSEQARSFLQEITELVQAHSQYAYTVMGPAGSPGTPSVPCTRCPGPRHHFLTPNNKEYLEEYIAAMEPRVPGIGSRAQSLMGMQGPMGARCSCKEH